MPEISRFYGIIIRMYCPDHNPPHFHATYGEHKASFSIHGLKLIEGEMPNRIKVMIIKWAFQHRFELLKNWELAVNVKNPKKIPPLE